MNLKANFLKLENGNQNEDLFRNFRSLARYERGL